MLVSKFISLDCDIYFNNAHIIERKTILVRIFENKHQHESLLKLENIALQFLIY